MKRTPASKIALGGMLAALATAMLCMGGLIPIATYAGPMLCMLILQIVVRVCGSSIGWAWYGAVALLSLLLCPDKEAAAVFCFLGYYPIVKPWLDGKLLSWLWKGILFNFSMIVMYKLLLGVFGMAELAAEFSELGDLVLVLMLVMGNVIFFLLDRLLIKLGNRK